MSVEGAKGSVGGSLRGREMVGTRTSARVSASESESERVSARVSERVSGWSRTVTLARGPFGQHVMQPVTNSIDVK